MKSRQPVSRFAVAALVATSAALSAPAAMAQAATAPKPAAAAATASPTVAEFARRAPVMAASAKVAAKPAAWGLNNADLSLLDDPALLRKAGLPGRAAEVAKAAQADDPLALYLQSAYLRSKVKDDTSVQTADGLMLRASQLGLVRAIGFVSAGLYIAAGTPEQQVAHFQVMKSAAATGSAFATYMYGQAMLLSKLSGEAERAEAIQAMGFAAEAGFAPAQLWYARMAYQAIDAGAQDPEMARRAKDALDKAIAQGNAEAIEFAKARAAKK